MKKYSETFYSWLKDHSFETPSSKLDQKILKMSESKLSTTKYPFYLKWKITSFVAVTSIVVIFAINTQMNHHSNLNKLVLTESPEMIINYSTIELMAQSSTLSENDWSKIQGEK